MGGIITNTDAETALSGLFVAGEACAGIHGANRLGGNALTEVFTMGCVAGGIAGWYVGVHVAGYIAGALWRRES